MSIRPTCPAQEFAENAERIEKDDSIRVCVLI